MWIATLLRPEAAKRTNTLSRIVPTWNRSHLYHLDQTIVLDDLCVAMATVPEVVWIPWRTV
jgi:hypothetical protein